MDGKEVVDADQAARPLDEKIALDKDTAAHHEKANLDDGAPELDTGRRQSVALNIIENPLRVSSAASHIAITN